MNYYLDDMKVGNLPIALSAGGVVVRLGDSDWWIALEQQPGRPVEGWCLPKGHVESGEDLETAARREIAEEVGATDLQLMQYLGKKERKSTACEEWKVIHYFLFSTNQIELKPQATDKVHMSKWFRLFDELPLVFDEQKEIVAQVKKLLCGS